MTCLCGDPECPSCGAMQGTLEPTCGDCPDFILGKNSKQRGLCYPFGEGKHMLHYGVSAKDIACQPRLRELKALAEVERLKGKLEAVAVIAVLANGMCPPPLEECTDKGQDKCRACWQKWIEE